MRVLITGASGFIGRHIAARLLAAGHQVLAVCRSRPGQAHPELAGLEWRAGDFAAMQQPDDWLPYLAGIDAVVNAAGILTESHAARFVDVHERGPMALFQACERVGLRRVIQISALGAGEGASSAYHRSKGVADRVLLDAKLEGVVLQPSLVYGADGASSRLLRALAVLPWLPMFRGGEPLVQPVHVDDLSLLVLRLLESPVLPHGVLPVVGPQALRFEALIATYRRQLGHGPGWVLWLPERLGDVAARLGELLPGSAFTRETWGMLKRGNTGDAGVLVTWLGRPGREPGVFIAPEQAAGLRAEALWGMSKPLLLASLVLLWWWSGFCSLFLAAPETNAALLAPLGLSAGLAMTALWGGSLLDMLLGTGLLLRAWRKRALLAQMAAILGYSLLVLVFLPDAWLHPFAPMVKNLPILALSFMLYWGER